MITNKRSMCIIIYDFETSGLNPYVDDIIEIGAYCLEDNTSFSTLLIPLSKKGIIQKITDITGITNDLLKKEGKKPLNAYTEFFDYLQEKDELYGSLTMIAHNGATFDDIFFRRMHKYLVDANIDVYKPFMESITYIDSLLVSRYVHPYRAKHSMDAMCGMYNIKNKSSHRAMGDVMALVDLWKQLLLQLKHKHNGVEVNNIRGLIYYE